MSIYIDPEYPQFPPQYGGLVLTADVGGHIPYSELKKKYDVSESTTNINTDYGISNDFMSNYNRSVLRDRTVEAPAFDHESKKDMKHFSTSILNHRYGGEGRRAGDKNPDMPEINTELTEFDPRGTATDPDMAKLDAYTWAKEYNLKRNLYPDKDEPIAIEGQISQWDIGRMKKSTFQPVKDRMVIFDTSYGNQVYSGLVQTKAPNFAELMSYDSNYKDTRNSRNANHNNLSMQNRTGLLQQTTTDTQFKEAKHGADPRSIYLAPGSTHPNVAYDTYLKNSDATQIRQSGNNIITDVLRAVTTDITLNESSMTPTDRRYRFEKLTNLINQLLSTESYSMDYKNSRENTLMRSANPKVAEQLARLVLTDDKVKRAFVDTVMSKSAGIHKYISLIEKINNDSKLIQTSISKETMMNKLGHINYSTEHLSNLTQGERAMNGRTQHLQNTQYTSNQLPQNVALGRLTASNDNINMMNHYDSQTRQTPQPKMLNNYMNAIDMHLPSDGSFKGGGSNRRGYDANLRFNESTIRESPEL
jgi:hypothetical protein